MAGPYGVSFVPGSQDQANGNNGGTGRPGAPSTPVQQAIKVLSLRLPKFFGSQSLAPAPLLSGPGGMGQPGAKGGSATAQAIAQMAGLPPSMAMPQPPVPTLSGVGGSGDGTGTYSGWAQHEKDLNRPGGDMPPSMPNNAPMPHFTPGVIKPPPGVIPDGPMPFPPDFYGLPADPPPGGIWDPPRGGGGDWTTIPDPAPVEQEPAYMPAPSPWEKPGRNPTLAAKYLELLDQFGGGDY